MNNYNYVHAVLLYSLQFYGMLLFYNFLPMYSVNPITYYVMSCHTCILFCPTIPLSKFWYSPLPLLIPCLCMVFLLFSFPFSRSFYFNWLVLHLLFICTISPTCYEFYYFWSISLGSALFGAMFFFLLLRGSFILLGSYLLDQHVVLA